MTLYDQREPRTLPRNADPLSNTRKYFLRFYNFDFKTQISPNTRDEMVSTSSVRVAGAGGK